MRSVLITWALCGVFGASATSMAQDASPKELGRVETVLGDGWRFTRGNPAGAATSGVDDKDWAVVHVPHDWAISGPMDPNGDSNSKFNWHGEGWYRYHLSLPREASGRRYYLDFDGVMAFPKVYVNGQLAGEWDYGYNYFRVDITPYVDFGGDTVIAVHADTRDHWSRWYPGAGLYRKVTLIGVDPVHVAENGAFVTTPQVSPDQAQVSVETTIDNTLASTAEVTVTTSVYAPNNLVPVASTTTLVKVAAATSGKVVQSVRLEHPQLWDLATPRLYQAQTVLKVDGEVRDRYVTNFGVRTMAFTKDQGFLLNGRRVQLHGVDLHADGGPLGAAFHARAAERQLEILQNMGVNAIRTSHNPPAPELLDLADRMGVLVFAECFDKWDQTVDRLPNVDLGTFAQRQMRNFIGKDRNHPSIMIWSIGNEIWDVETNFGGNAAAQVETVAKSVRANDPTRPVTMATHLVQALDTGLHQYLDVESWNYGRKYESGRQFYPDKPELMSESASAVSTRGDYSLPLPNSKDAFPAAPVLSSYDFNAASWGDIADVEFQAIAAHPYVAGEFVWSGFDYIGEPTPYENAARSSYFGIVDLVGIPKDRYYLYRSYWRPEAETVHILPHWNWPDRVGKTLPVFVYTNGDSAELFLNGRSLGVRVKTDPQAPLPQNFALHKPVSASSEELSHGNLAKNAVDGDSYTRWCAADGQPNAWWQVDLGAPTKIRSLNINFEQDPARYQYFLSGSDDGKTWHKLAQKSDFNASKHEGYLEVSTVARYLRVDFTALKAGVYASIREFEVYGELVDRSYFAVTNAYRLRWDDVAYAPGELTAVAYRGSTPIGEAHVRTAAPPTRVVLQADRHSIAADGDDLSYITVTARDDHGTIDPDGSQLVHLDLEGPGLVVGVGNGDPNSTDPFVAADIRLFHGRGIAIVRGQSGRTGPVSVTATALNLAPGHVALVMH